MDISSITPGGEGRNTQKREGSELPPHPMEAASGEGAKGQPVVGLSITTATGTSAEDGGLEVGEECMMEEKEKQIDFAAEVEHSLEAEGGMEGEGGGGEPSGVHMRRRVQFKDAISVEFDDTNLWAHDPNETAQDMIEVYKRECASLKTKPLTKLLEQLERLDDLGIPIDTLDLKGVRMDSRTCEVLEAVLSRLQMTTLDLERTNLEDEGAIALFEMIEFYGCASKVVLANNSRLRPRAWLSIGRTLKKSPFIEMISVSYCGLEEQTLTLLLRSVRANCALQVLKIEGNNLTGKGTFILMAAMKFNENLRELWLGSNHLGPEDGQHLGSILRVNHTLRVLDVRENNLQDAGVRYICAGVAEQQEGLYVLNLTSNNISQEGVHHVSAMLPCTRSLRELNLSFNRCGDNGLFMLKLGLLANRSIEKLNLSNTKMTCEGSIALAEVLAESKHITHLDLKENDIRVAGLLALQLAHRMNHTLLFMETPKAFRVEQRDRPLIKSLLQEIDRYCARNLREKELKAESERRRQHEVQHAQVVGSGEETSEFTAGEANREGEGEEEEPEKEVDPSLVGSLDNVYKDEPGAPMKDDPFYKVPVMDSKEKPASLMEMEKSLDALAVSCAVDPAQEPNPQGGEQDFSDMDFSSLDRGTRSKKPSGENPFVNRMLRPPQQAEKIELDSLQKSQQQSASQPLGGSSHNRPPSDELLPDLVDIASTSGLAHSNPSTPPPDIQLTSRGSPQAPDVASSGNSPSIPLDLAVGAQRSVDLLDEASQSNVVASDPGVSQPMDLTDGLLQISSNRSSSQET